jgi:hypothetical protein
MHTDWWRCDRCQIKQPRITEDFDYELSCPICGKAMKLLSRTPEDEDETEVRRLSAIGLTTYGGRQLRDE